MPNEKEIEVKVTGDELLVLILALDDYTKKLLKDSRTYAPPSDKPEGVTMRELSEYCESVKYKINLAFIELQKQEGQNG